LRTVVSVKGMGQVLSGGNSKRGQLHAPNVAPNRPRMSMNWRGREWTKKSPRTLISLGLLLSAWVR